MHFKIIDEVERTLSISFYGQLKAVCTDQEKIYCAPAEASGRDVLEDFNEKWKSNYPMIYTVWFSRRIYRVLPVYNITPLSISSSPIYFPDNADETIIRSFFHCIGNDGIRAEHAEQTFPFKEG